MIFLIHFIFSFMIINIKGIIDLNEVVFFATEICSYNGFPIIIQIEGISKVQCQCLDEYATDPTVRKMNGNEVQCSYKKKRRITALFYALLLPFGFSDLYLRNYTSFSIIFLISVFGCFAGIISLAKEEKYHQTETMQNGRERDQQWTIFGRWIYIIFVILFICYWIINFCLVTCGVIKDGNGYEMYNDLSFIKNYFE